MVTGARCASRRVTAIPRPPEPPKTAIPPTLSSTFLSLIARPLGWGVSRGVAVQIPGQIENLQAVTQVEQAVQTVWVDGRAIAHLRHPVADGVLVHPEAARRTADL